MKRRYIVRAGAEFSSAHVLRGYGGACNRVHGHNFKVEAEVETRTLDGVGMSVDFTALEAVLRTIASDLDHRWLNEIHPFDEVNPTAENLGAYFWSRVELRLSEIAPDRDAVLRAIVIRENDRSAITYIQE